MKETDSSSQFEKESYYLKKLSQFMIFSLAVN